MTKVEIDAKDQSLGRLASRIAILLRGKHLATYQHYILPEVEVSVKNLDKVKFTGKKFTDKLYHKYSGYHSGLRTRTLKERWERSPLEVLKYSVYRMLPNNKTRDKIIRNLKIAK